MNNKIAIGVLVKPSQKYTHPELPTVSTVEIGSNITVTKNKILRQFVHDQFNESDYFVLYNTSSELRTLDFNELSSKADEYVKAIDATGINCFTGTLTPKTTIDYGDVKINIGTGEEQKVIIEVLTRKAIKAVGYFDVRLQDTLCAQDYAIRLGNTQYYPSRSSKTSPWLFDIVHNVQSIAKHTLDPYASGWYKYKHDTLPWEQLGADIELLKPQLKEIKNVVTG